MEKGLGVIAIPLDYHINHIFTSFKKMHLNISLVKLLVKGSHNMMDLIGKDRSWPTKLPLSSSGDFNIKTYSGRACV
jgi:hypothetical protein